MTMLLRPGDTFGGCRILSLCGVGGTGMVYLAHDMLGRTVALKLAPLCDAQRELAGIRMFSLFLFLECSRLSQIWNSILQISV